MGMLGWQDVCGSPDGSTITRKVKEMDSAPVAVARSSWAERRHGLFRLARRRPTVTGYGFFRTVVGLSVLQWGKLPA